MRTWEEHSQGDLLEQVGTALAGFPGQPVDLRMKKSPKEFRLDFLVAQAKFKNVERADG
jgi:hypothetical protein